MSTHTRRHFLGLSTAALAGLAQARPPIAREGAPRLRTSLAAYSFRDSFKEPGTLDMFQFIDYCADHGFDGTELTSYFFPTDADDAYFQRIKQHAFLRGIAISGTAVGNNFALPDGDELSKQIADTNAWIDRAAVMGAPHVRVFAGAPKGIDAKTAMTQCIQSLEACCHHAGEHGIFLGLENHGGIVAEADALLEIVEAVKSPWLGINLDTGNFRTADPYGDLKRCAPYAVNVQVKVEIQKRGGPKVLADLPRLMYLLREANYQGYVALEYEAKEDPWEALPEWITRFQRLARG